MYGRTECDFRVRFIGEGSMHPKLCCYRSRSTNFNTVDMQKIQGRLAGIFCEYILSENPRLVAKTFGEVLKEWLK